MAFPDSVYDRLTSLINTALPNVEISDYAGEFFEEDRLRKLAKRANSVDQVLMAISRMPDFGDEQSADLRIQDLSVEIELYCVSANRRDMGLQSRQALNLAWDVAKALTGEEFASSAENANGFFRYDEIVRDFARPDIAAYTLRISLPIKADTDQ